MIGSLKHMCLYITSHLHWKALFKGEVSDALLSHPEKIYTSLAQSFWDCPPLGIRSMRRNLCPGSRDQLTCEWLRREALFEETQNENGLNSVPVDFYKIFSYKQLEFHPDSQAFTMGSKNFNLSFFFFSFLLLLLRAKYQSLENTGKIACFSFCSFLRFVFANVLWVPHSLDIAWQLVIKRSISLWPCLARNATSLLRFKACCWLARSPEYLCPLLMLRIQGKEAGNQQCQKQLRIGSHHSPYWSPSLGTFLAVQWLRLVFQWWGWGFDP